MCFKQTPRQLQSTGEWSDTDCQRLRALPNSVKSIRNAGEGKEVLEAVPTCQMKAFSLLDKTELLPLIADVGQDA